MQVHVTVSFPVSDSDWMKLQSLRSLFAGTTLPAKFLPKKEVEEGTVSEVSSEERMILEQALERTHNEQETSVLDGLEMSNAGRLRPNMTQEVVKFFKKHPGMTITEAAPIIQDMYPQVYGPNALARVKTHINSAVSARYLKKVGGRVGRGGASKIYLVNA